MKPFLPFSLSLFLLVRAFGQSNPAVTRWMINTTGITGRHYVTGNTTPISDPTLPANVQQVQYSANYAYIKASGIPAYVIGPYPDGNPSSAGNQSKLYKIPLNPVQQTGTQTAVGLGRTGVFINGVPLFNYSDARSYQNQGKWNNNAIVFENIGFDCAKGHPQQQGQYHHHQNPSAFNVASVVNSTVCNPYLADGLYVPDTTQHGPLVGFAFDGFPIYGASGYSNPLDPASPARRMKSSYRLRNITNRTTLPDGTLATGPAIGATVQNGPTSVVAVLGAYKEDYEYVEGSGDLDIHNGRFCKTPEYPNGIYCYFATIDQNGNSAFPYIIGQTYYGVVETTNFNNVTISEPVTTFDPTTSTQAVQKGMLDVTVYPNPANELLVIQSTVSQNTNRSVELLNLQGKVMKTETLYQGSTMCYFDLQAIYAGIYFVRIADGQSSKIVQVTIAE